MVCQKVLAEVQHDIVLEENPRVIAKAGEVPLIVIHSWLDGCGESLL